MPRPSRSLALPLVLTLVLLASACGHVGPEVDPAQVDSTAPPSVGACRVLTPDEVEQASNATVTVDCGQKHTAETYAVGPLPDQFADASYDDDALGAWAYRTCETKFEAFLGADESMAMRTVLSWAWFRPSEKAWDKGARWYRCDVVGGSEQSTAYTALPKTARGLLLEKDTDPWMVCADGPTVAAAKKVPCTQPHVWRAVTTIKLGEDGDRYPGDKLVEARTRDYCSDSVGAWLNYPVDYDFGYTWFHAGEWSAGNRRSICWAKTDQ